MTEFEDLDALLDFEAELEAEQGARKRSAADLASQRDAAALLEGDAKRTRTEITTGTQIDDDELLELALQDHQGPGNGLGAASAPRGAMHQVAVSTVSQASEMSVAQRKLPATEPSDFENLDFLLDMEEGNDATGAAPKAPAQMNLVPPTEPQGSLDLKEDEEEDEEMKGQEDLLPRQALDTMLPLRPFAPPLRDAIDVQGDYLTVTSADGERVYAPLAPSQGAFASASKVDIAGALRRAQGTLLSCPVEDLMQQVEKDQFERALAETAAENEKQAAEAAENAADNAANAGEAPGSARRASKKQKQSPGKAGKAAASASSLWVEKYAPKGFLDLLSDEQINRDVVRWLKSWDSCVFGAEDTMATAKNAAASRARGDKRSGGGKSDYSDPFGRPEQKVILLCGPPGLGKTTLAHVVARHCGYRPVEINASDDRSGATLTGRVLDAVQMQSVMGEKRPNCLIIDEIDGAAGGAEGRSAISALIKIVTAAPGKKTKGGAGQAQENGDAGGASDSEDEEEGGAAKGRLVKGKPKAGTGPAKQKLRPLMRPIICICNDLYAPTLRPLRDIAKIFHFRRPSAERLAHRLQLICGAEGLRAEKSTLRMLAERTECDVRSCLNTLQFLSKRQKIIRQTDLHGLGIGQKDMTKGAFQVWGELLQKKKAPSIIGKVAETEAQRTTRLYNMLLDFGESDLVLSGVHESMPSLRFFDIGLHRTTSVLANLQDADELMRKCQRSGDFSLMKYLPAPALQVSALVAGPERPNVQWPRAGPEVRRKTAANQAIIHQWLLGMSPVTFTALGAAAAVEDLLPLLPSLTTPALRPVSRHLFSKDEQACVDRLVGTLLSLGLKYSLYVEDMGDGDDDVILGDGTAGTENSGLSKDPPLQFRPAVHRLWHFKGSSAVPAARRSLPIASRQMVLHEAEMEAIRRADAARQNAMTAAMDLDQNGEEKASEQPQQQQPTQNKTAGHVPLDLAQRLREAGVAGKVAKASIKKVKGTWLDQLREKQHADKAAAATAAAIANGGGVAGPNRFPVLYKFHEGYTNAVKRPVLMSELL